MGANAQTTVPTFTASQVLTADQMNQSARTGVPVFASTVTRDAAFGGTGEKTLAEGQMCYIEGTGFQTYNGTSWVTWGTAPSTGALVTVKAETAFSAVSSVTADNVFTSTYTSYRLVLRYTTTTSANSINLRLRTGGVSAATNYNVQDAIFYTNLSLIGRTTGATSLLSVGDATNGTFYSQTIIDIMSPQIAEATNFIFTNNISQGAYTAPVSRFAVGNHSDATAYDGVELLVASGTTSGHYTIYGYAK